MLKNCFVRFFIVLLGALFLVDGKTLESEKDREIEVFHTKRSDLKDTVKNESVVNYAASAVVRGMAHLVGVVSLKSAAMFGLLLTTPGAQSVIFPRDSLPPEGYVRIEQCPNQIVPRDLIEEVQNTFEKHQKLFCRYCKDDSSICEIISLRTYPHTTAKCGLDMCDNGVTSFQEDELREKWEKEVKEICKNIEDSGGLFDHGFRCAEVEPIIGLNQCVHKICKRDGEEKCPYPWWKFWKSCNADICTPQYILHDKKETIAPRIRECYLAFCPEFYAALLNANKQRTLFWLKNNVL